MILLVYGIRQTIDIERLFDCIAEDLEFCLAVAIDAAKKAGQVTSIK